MLVMFQLSWSEPHKSKTSKFYFVHGFAADSVIISTRITNSITWLLQNKLNWFFESRILGLSIWPSAPPVVEDQSSQVTKILRSIKETLNPHPYNPVQVVCSAKICSNLVKTSSLVIQTSTHSFTRSHLPFDFKWNVQVDTYESYTLCHILSTSQNENRNQKRIM
jgi:hypothetical protein